MPPAVHLVNLPGPAILAIARYRRTGEVVVLIDQDEPWRLVVGIVRALLPRHERREVYRVLLTH